MPTLTQISETKKGRYALFFDGEFAFSLDAGTFADADLHQDDELEPWQIEELRKKSDTRRALDKDGFTDVKVASTDGLITDYCKQVGATVIVKGLRQNGDYEAELGMALVNRKLSGVETLFLPADPVLEHISSSIVKDVARHGGDVTGMVPDCVAPMLVEALQQEKSR